MICRLWDLAARLVAWAILAAYLVAELLDDATDRRGPWTRP